MRYSTLGEVCDIQKGKTGITKAIEGKYPFVTTAEARKTHNEYHFDKPSIIIPLVSSTGHGHASIKRIHYQDGKFSAGSILGVVTPKNPNEVDAKYLYAYLLTNKDDLLVSLMKGAANVSLPVSRLKTAQIPIPSMEKQLKIVKKYDRIREQTGKLSNTLNGDNKTLQNLRQQILHEYSTGVIKLEKYVVKTTDKIGISVPKNKMIGVSNKEGVISLNTNKKEGFSKYKVVTNDTFLYNPMRINVGSLALYEGDEVCITSPDYVVFRVKDNYPSKALLFFLKSQKGLELIIENVQGSVRQRLYFKNLCNINIPEFDSEDYQKINKLFHVLEQIENNIKIDMRTLSLLNQVISREVFKEA